MLLVPLRSLHNSPEGESKSVYRFTGALAVHGLIMCKF